MDPNLAQAETLVLDLHEDGTLARASMPEPLAPGESVQRGDAFMPNYQRYSRRTGWRWMRRRPILYGRQCSPSWGLQKRVGTLIPSMLIVSLCRLQPLCSALPSVRYDTGATGVR